MKRKCKIIGKHLLLAFLAFIWLIPIIWLFVTSLSGYKGINTKKVEMTHVQQPIIMELRNHAGKFATVSGLKNSCA